MTDTPGTLQNDSPINAREREAMDEYFANNGITSYADLLDHIDEAREAEREAHDRDRETLLNALPRTLAVAIEDIADELEREAGNLRLHAPSIASRIVDVLELPDD